MYGAVDAEDVGVEVICPRAAAIVVEVVFVLLPAPRPLCTDMLAVKQVAVDAKAGSVISKLTGILFIAPIEHLLVAQLPREWEVG